MKRILGTFMPAKRVYLCPHNLLQDRAGECPECAAKREANRLIARMKRTAVRARETGETNATE